MRKYTAFTLMVLIIVGCSSTKNASMVKYADEEISEVLSPMGNYSIYDYFSPKVESDVEDTTSILRYHILLPPKKDIRRILSTGEDRCFLFSKGRGIAIIQDSASKTHYKKGYRDLSSRSIKEQLSVFKGIDNLEIKDNKRHGICVVEHGVRVYFFNLSYADFHDYVHYSLMSLHIITRSNGKDSTYYACDEIKGML